jgi:hypothetical protein
MRVRFNFRRVFLAADQAAFKRLSPVQRFSVMLQILSRVRGELEALVMRDTEPSLFSLDPADRARMARLRQLSVIDREAQFNRILSQARGAAHTFLDLDTGAGHRRSSGLATAYLGGFRIAAAS